MSKGRLEAFSDGVSAAIGSDRKGKASSAIYAVSVPMAMLNPAIAFVLYAAVAAIWIVPDRRIERVLDR